MSADAMNRGRGEAVEYDLILVDSPSIIYRGHYAMIKAPLRGADGTVTSGLSHLLTELFQIASGNPNSRIAAVGDAPGPSFRNSIYPAYKANRPKTPPDIKVQIDIARELIPLLGISYVEHAGLEADDIIAGLAGQGESVLVVSPDKDLLQLVNDRVSVLRPGRYGGSSTLVQKGSVEDVLGVEAERVTDLLALMGDSSDNVPGARGIGAKGASDLIQRYGSVKNIYDSIECVEPLSVRKKLVDSKESVLLSMRLVKLDPSLPSELLSLDLSVRPPCVSEALPFLQRLSLNRIAEKAGVSMEAGELPLNTPFTCMVHITDDPATAALPGSGPLAIDTETTSTDPLEASLIGFAFTTTPEECWYHHCISQGSTVKALEFVAREAIRRGFVAQNAKFDSRVLAKHGIELPPPVFDPYLADYLLRPDSGEHSLKKLVPLWLGKTLTTFDQASNGTGTLANRPVQDVAEYCCGDAASTLALYKELSAELHKDPALLKVLNEVELPLSAVLARMETMGIGLDRSALRVEGESVSREIVRLLDKAAIQLGRPVNLASPAQVSTALFDNLGLSSVRKTGRGASSTGMTVLEALRGKHPFVETVIEFRELSKLQNTYIEKLPGYVSPVTGLIHTSFNQAVTATGRLSSSSPNLQNIPIRTARGREIRRCFVPPVRGHVFVTADYSQIELRILAHLAGEGALREAYRNGEDIHRATAMAVFGSGDPESRRRAKEVNFSIVYGISPYGLSQRLAISRGEASGIIERYYRNYPEVRAFFEETVESSRISQETRTILGRKRPFPGFRDARGNARSRMERAAVNTRVQGSAADMIKLAMIRVHERLRKELPGSGMVLQVHDELVVSCPKDSWETAEAVLKQEMQSALPLDVPVTVETGWGTDWLSAGHKG